MRRFISITLLVLLAACGAKNATNGLSIDTSFAPDPPRQGTEAVTVRLHDASGQPVKGAAVTIATTMPKMSMSGPTATATDNGDGSYTAHIVVQYATKWVFSITATANGTTTNVTVDRVAH